MIRTPCGFSTVLMVTGRHGCVVRAVPLRLLRFDPDIVEYRRRLDAGAVAGDSQADVRRRGAGERHVTEAAPDQPVGRIPRAERVDAGRWVVGSTHANPDRRGAAD